MTDDQYRGLLTEREREILSGEVDVSKNYFYRVKSRVRDKMDQIGDDVEFLEENESELAEEFYSNICNE